MHLVFRQRGSGGDDALGHRLRHETIAIEPAAIIRDVDQDVAAGMERGEFDRAFLGLARPRRISGASMP